MSERRDGLFDFDTVKKALPNIPTWETFDPIFMKKQTPKNQGIIALILMRKALCQAEILGDSYLSVFCRYVPAANKQQGSFDRTSLMLDLRESGQIKHLVSGTFFISSILADSESDQLELLPALLDQWSRWGIDV